MMNGIKGTERRTVVVKTTNSKIFEAAYFLLRCGAEDKVKEGDMVEEAVKIIKCVSCDAEARKSRSKSRLRQIFCLISAAIAGAVISTVVFLLIQ